MPRFLSFTLLITFLCSAGFASTEAKAMPADFLHPLFSDHAVIQRDVAVPIWGTGPAGATVTVSFAGQIKEAKVGDDGKWMCTLDPMPASFESRTLVVSNPRLNQADMAKDILVGDVWLCSGQSNMELGMALCNEDEEIKKADHPSLRLLTIPHDLAYTPQDRFKASWRRCSPEGILQDNWGGFSAAAYFFGKKLQEELKIPIGLIHSSWGGTLIEGWTSAETLKTFPECAKNLRQVEDIANSTAKDPVVEAMDQWFQEHDPGTQQEWHKATTDTSKWRDVTFPNNWGACGIGGHEGVTWIQREIEVPADWAKVPLVLKMGTISDTDTTWINGKEVGRTNFFEVPSIYEVPVGIVEAGRNVVTLRITNAGGGGIQNEQAPLEIRPARINPDGKTPTMVMSGKWKLKETSAMNKTGRPIVGNPRVPSVLYNAMIAPLTPAALTGVIWYQGEANASQAKLYQKLLPAMIGDWRNDFEKDDLAFHIVSLANYQEAADQPRDNPWAELREAQAITAKTVPHCGLAVAIDIGDEQDIHPKNKREVGHRLALSALAETYDLALAGSGPWYREMKIEGDKIRLHFDHVHGGLQFKGETDKSFAIAGADGKFVWATPEIEGETVIVSSPAVTKPVAVRYAWDSSPQACLYNAASLPAVPFRTGE